MDLEEPPNKDLLAEEKNEASYSHLEEGIYCTWVEERVK